jgi:hypothetical protein
MINFIKDHMVTKLEFNEAVEKLDNRITAVESKIGGIHNRIDGEVGLVGGDVGDSVGSELHALRGRRELWKRQSGRGSQGCRV